MCYFHKKTVKIAKRWGLWPQTLLPSAAGGSVPRSQHQSSCIVNSFLLHLPTCTQTLSKSTKRPYWYIFVIIARVHHEGFRRRKKYACISYAKDYINYNYMFQFFSLCSHHSFCAGAAPASRIRYKKSDVT